jgi:hypothetical protein
MGQRRLQTELFIGRYGHHGSRLTLGGSSGGTTRRPIAELTEVSQMLSSRLFSY